MSIAVHKKNRIVAAKNAPKGSGRVASATERRAGDQTAVKRAAAQKAASHILSAPKGPRRLTHREIKEAVERVFVRRYGADA